MTRRHLLAALFALSALPVRAGEPTGVRLVRWTWKALDSGALQVEGRVQNTSEWLTEDKVELHFVGRSEDGKEAAGAFYRIGRLGPGAETAFRFEVDRPKKPVIEAELRLVGPPGEW